MAIAVGDGHFASGEESLHTPVPVLEDLFSVLQRTSRVGWDGFHRYDKSGTEACKQVDLAARFFDVLRELEYIYSVLAKAGP